MITRSEPNLQGDLWQSELKNGFSRLPDLLSFLDLSPEQFADPSAAIAEFSLRVPRGFAARMKKGDPADPLLLQVLPNQLEMLPSAEGGYYTDPLAESAKNPIPGLLHKYADRVLLVLTGSCAINCRYCFRRHFDYSDNQATRPAWEPMLTYIAANSQINEVILSGGDPLLLKDELLTELLARLSTIPHLKRLRIHSRIPVVLPSRITPKLLELFAHCRLQTVLVLHSNHAQEIDEAVVAMARRVQQQGITLLNQTVLLKGINDEVGLLAELSEALFAAGIIPYYLHLLDKVQGAAHFDLPLSRALELYQQLQARLSGYLVPRLVRETAGAPNKVLMGLS
jgi:EF-P beta-lysylation protein EpmB